MKQVVFVTGPSGAGRSSAIRVLEDLGFEAIDNIPMQMVPRLVDASPTQCRLALGLDTRNRDFSTSAVLDLFASLQQQPEIDPTILYLDCRTSVLLKRFSETRRRHPMAPQEEPELGVRREKNLLADIQDAADCLIDTSELNIHQLRREVERRYAPQGGPTLAVSVQSFSYKRGLPVGLDMVFDCRFLSNPYWTPELRPLDGRDAPVADHVRGDARFEPFQAKVQDLVEFLIPAYTAEGKTHLTIGFGCTGGQHRSVMLTETVAKTLAEQGAQVSIRHRELERQTGE